MTIINNNHHQQHISYLNCTLWVAKECWVANLVMWNANFSRNCTTSINGSLNRFYGPNCIFFILVPNLISETCGTIWSKVKNLLLSLFCDQIVMLLQVVSISSNEKWLSVKLTNRMTGNWGLKLHCSMNSRVHKRSNDLRIHNWGRVLFCWYFKG